MYWRFCLTGSFWLERILIARPRCFLTATCVVIENSSSSLVVNDIVLPSNCHLAFYFSIFPASNRLQGVLVLVRPYHSFWVIQCMDNAHIRIDLTEEVTISPAEPLFGK
ncbi:hypothetical protein B0H34DRAFT_435087 [Crassisporium funariophilum]|nr:hypothetical protein B0H34DRAFT_435087 [Crassisporium funariophilum]